MSEDINDYFKKKSTKNTQDKSEKQNYINLKCSECNESNKVKLSTELKCKKCEQKLSGFDYKKFILPTVAVIGLSGISGAILDDTLNLNRASVKTEYKMMRTCIYEFQDRDTCFCAVESMSGFIDAEKARLYGRKWLEEVLKDKYDSCKD